MYKLEVICMYCGKHLRTHDVKRKEEAGVSHGICNECFKKVNEELKEYDSLQT